MKEAEFGAVDILHRHSVTPAREEFLLPIRYGYIERDLVFMISPILQSDITSIEELEQFTIGSLRGSLYSADLENNKKLNRVYFETHEQIIKMLELGRIDVAPTSQSHKFEVYRAIPGVREASYKLSFLSGRYMSIPKKSPMAKHHKTLEKIVRDMALVGDIDRIFNAYDVEPPLQK